LTTAPRRVALPPPLPGREKERSERLRVWSLIPRVPLRSTRGYP
jgi:hypothetical protein